jgi:hypothetical protein
MRILDWNANDLVKWKIVNAPVDSKVKVDGPSVFNINAMVLSRMKSFKSEILCYTGITLFINENILNNNILRSIPVS